jgi:hypothetical protein
MLRGDAQAVPDMDRHFVAGAAALAFGREGESAAGGVGGCFPLRACLRRGRHESSK